MSGLVSLKLASVVLACSLLATPVCAAESESEALPLNEDGPLAAGGPAAQVDLRGQNIGQYIDIGLVAVGLSLGGILLIEDNTDTAPVTTTSSTN